MSTPHPTRTPAEIEALEPLTSSEWEVMNICWELEEATLPEVVARYKGSQRSRDFKTVQLLLRRIQQKGYLGSVRGHLLARHQPLAPRLPVLRREFESFLSRVAGRDPEMLDWLVEWIEESRRQ